jgi:FtsH-binding integral membrane protein
MEMQEPGKTRAIISHITLIGWIIAIVQNSSDKNEDASFYIRQVLGLMILGVGMQIIVTIFAFIPILNIIMGLVGWIVFLAIIGAWVYSLVSAINGKKEPTPFVGGMFQQWFKSL